MNGVVAAQRTPLFWKGNWGYEKATAALQQTSANVSNLPLSMSWDNNTFLSHNLKHFSCQCEWMSTLHTSPWLWAVEYSSYSMRNVFQLKIYMEARFYQINISICQKSKPRKATTPMKIPLNSGVYYSFHSHLGIWVILSRINHKLYAVSFYTV